MKTVVKEVKLTEEEVAYLGNVTNGGSPKQILYANILLMSNRGNTPKKIKEALGISTQTVNSVKQRFFKEGAEKCLIRRNAGRSPYPAKITGEVEAKIVALACGKVPEGRSRWSLALLADKSVELKIIDSISDVSVMTLLKKRNLSLI